MRSLSVVLRLGSLVLLVTRLHAQEVLLEVSGPATQSFGRAHEGVGDTNGDGFGEFLVGAPDANGVAGVANAGKALLYSGRDGSLLATFRGTGVGDRFGYASGAAGDVNGDGAADLVLAAYGDNVAGVGVDAGSVQIVSGLDGSVLHSFTGAGAGARLGRYTAASGDVDGDGRDDVLLRSSDSLTTYSGRDGSILRQVQALGFRAARLGDVNGDGVEEVGVLEYRSPYTLGMYVQVLSGADGSELWVRGAGHDDASFGSLDANGDGLADMAIGMPFVDSGAGSVRLFSGPNGVLLREVFGDEAQDRLGTSVLGAGDLDGDGYGDFAVGIPGFDGVAGVDTGAVRAFSGRTGAVIATIEGGSPGEGLGADLSAGRDVNGDGIPDVIASSTPDLAPDSTDLVKVKVLSFVPRGLVPFGTGSPGCLGSSTLLACGGARLGASFELHAANVGASPLLLVGDAEDTAGTLFQRALFHIDPAPPPPALGVVFQSALPAPDANGSVIATLTIPSTPALLGQTFVFQVASLFPAGPCAQRVATSRGLRVTIQ